MRLTSGTRLASLLRSAVVSPSTSKVTLARVPFARFSSVVSKETGLTQLTANSSALSQFTHRALANDVSLAIRSFGTRAVVDASLPSVQDRDTDAKDRMTSQSRRNFTYFMVGGLRFMYASIIRFAVVRFVATMTMSAKVLALASIEVELDAIEEGKCSLITFRGKPLFVRHRTAEETADPDAGIDIAALKDPQSDLERCPRPEWVVCMGVCTHLGCVPTALAGDYNGWFCPCHGSHYDTCGRIRKGPAPLNLEIPDYSFVTDDLLKVG